MEKKIEDYLHLYIGCEAMVDYCGVNKSLINGVHFNHKRSYCEVRVISLQSEQNVYPDKVKPILRPLSDMTEEEFTEVCNILNWDNNEYDVEWFITEYTDIFLRITLIHSFELTKYLLSKGFDLFGLIENNLAINKNNL